MQGLGAIYLTSVNIRCSLNQFANIKLRIFTLAPDDPIKYRLYRGPQR